MPRPTKTEIEVTLQVAIVAGSIRNVDYKDLTQDANRGFENAVSYRNEDLAAKAGRYWETLDFGTQEERKALALLQSKPSSVLHAPGWIKRATAKGLHTKIEALGIYVAAIEPWVETANLLVAARPLIVKGRKPDPEAEAKEAARLAVAKTCQYCGRPILAEKGLIAHHGYTRPEQGSGVQTASCPGARLLRYEVTAADIPAWVREQDAMVTAYRLAAESYRKTSESLPRETKRNKAENTVLGVYIWDGYRSAEHKPTAENIRSKPGDTDYEWLRNLIIHDCEQREKSHRDERDRLQKRIDDWTPNNKGWRT
jgi:hypothetical protein